MNVREYCDYKLLLVITMYIIIIGTIFTIGIITEIASIIYISISLLLLISVFNILPIIIIISHNHTEEKMITNFIKQHKLKDHKISKDSSCSICLDNINDNTLFCFKDCKHEYHLECIKKWVKHNKNCPVCRKQYP